MTLNQLRYFQAVARLQNFRAAAEELYISQPSLSRSIDSLEDELGVVLFERAGRGISFYSLIGSSCGKESSVCAVLVGGSGCKRHLRRTDP